MIFPAFLLCYQSDSIVGTPTLTAQKFTTATWWRDGGPSMFVGP